jgi:hypothetical protein
VALTDFLPEVCRSFSLLFDENIYYAFLIFSLLFASTFVDCKSGILDFVHRLYFNKIITFRKLDLLPSSGKKGRTETLPVGPPG